VALLNTLANNRFAKNAVGGALNALPGYSTLGNQIKDPTVNYQGNTNPNYSITPLSKGRTGVLDYVTTRETPVGGASGGAGTASNPEAEAARYQLESSLGQYNNALGRIDPQLQTAIGNIQGDFQSAYDRLTGQGQIAKRNFETGRDNQLQEYQGARDANNANSRNLLMGARRLLGSQGAGGGSADLFAAPLAATREANNANAVVKQTNERNLGALTTAYDDDQRNIGNSLSDLTRQRDQGVRDTQSQFEQQRAEALGAIGALSGQRALLNGQNYQQALAAAAPYTNRVQGILSQIDSLAARPSGVREQAVNLARPDLAQYSLSRFDAPAQARQDPSLGAAPAYNTLAGLSDDQRRQLGY